MREVRSASHRIVWPTEVKEGCGDGGWSLSYFDENMGTGVFATRRVRKLSVAGGRHMNNLTLIG